MLLKTLFLTSRLGQNVIKAMFWLTMFFWIATSCTDKNTKVSNNNVQSTVYHSAQIVAQNNARMQANQRRHYYKKESRYNRHNQRGNNQPQSGFTAISRTLTSANKLVSTIGRIAN